MQKKLSRRPAAKPLPASSPPFYPPFDRENDALRFPALLSPRMKSLNGIWMMDTRRAKPGESFFTPDFEAHNWQGVPIPCSATPDVHMLRLLREFELDSSWLKKENGTILLRFEGAGPALSVWINGVFIGCVKTKNDFAEFDITGRVQNGINRIAVLLRRTGKDESAFLKIDQGVHLILQPRIGFQTADVRLDSRKITLGLTVRNSSERDQMLDLSVKLLDRNNVVRPGRMIFRGLAVKAQSGTAFSLAEPFRRFWPGLKKQSI